jgi:hypothetical protein
VTSETCRICQATTNLDENGWCSPCSETVGASAKPQAVNWVVDSVRGAFRYTLDLHSRRTAAATKAADEALAEVDRLRAHVDRLQAALLASVPKRFLTREQELEATLRQHLAGDDWPRTAK